MGICIICASTPLSYIFLRSYYIYADFFNILQGNLIPRLTNQYLESNIYFEDEINVREIYGLEKQGMVTRERSEEDRRVVYVSLSPHFKETHQHFHKNLRINIENVMKQGTVDDVNAIFIGLNTLKKLLSGPEK